jgi:hypothetical protein
MAAKSINTILISSVFMTTIFSSCLTAGTHGTIKSYEYTTNKYTLQKAVEKVIANNKNIMLDTTQNYIIDQTNNGNDTIANNYYNDGERYVTIRITDGKGYNDYTFQYVGDKNYWDTSKKSNLSIAYARDQDGNGGSEGNGGISSSLKSKFVKTFERELISKLDIELKQKHSEPD